MVNLSRRFALVALSALALVACGPNGGSETPSGNASAGANGELGHVLGSPDAPVTLIEYASPTCPACKHFHENIKPALQAQYVDTGKVRFIYREFPLNQIDIDAYALARCAGPDRYFDVLDDLFANQDGVRYAAQNGVHRITLATIGQRHGIADQAAFDACLADRDIRQAIADTIATGDRYGIDGTPTFIIDGVKRNYQGDYTNVAGFSRQLDAVLAAKQAQ